MDFIKFDAEKCSLCGVCVEKCPFGALSMGEKGITVGDTCRMCGLCVRQCPEKAIKFEQKANAVDKSQWKDFLVFVEQEYGDIHPVAYELIGEAKKLAAKVGYCVNCVIIGGKGTEENAKKLLPYGVNQVFVYEHSGFEGFRADCYADAAADCIAAVKPSSVLIGATALGRSLAPRLATRFHTGLTADCTRLSIDPQSGNLLQQRPAFGGNLLATIVTPDHRPQMASVRPGVMKAIAPRSGFVGEITLCEVPAVGPSAVEIVASRLNETRGSSIADARIVVGGGRGMQCAANMALLQELADVLGGSVAGSRAAVEAGWIGFENQVGQTGRSIAPDLYIACGISGQIQHTAGLTGAGTIVAINNDPAAPIFSVADYGIVGDVTDVLPRLVAALRA